MLIENKNVFPLSTLNPAFNGYYMSLSGDVYSTRAGKKLTQLAGTTFNGKHYFTLAGMTIDSDVLKRQATQSAAFFNETADTATGKVVSQVVSDMRSRSVDTTPTPAPVQPAPAHKAPTSTKVFKDGIAAKGYVIASISRGGNFVVSPDPMFHLTEDSLKAEMERLAHLNPGTQYVALKITSSVIASGIIWS